MIHKVACAAATIVAMVSSFSLFKATSRFMARGTSAQLALAGNRAWTRLSSVPISPAIGPGYAAVQVGLEAIKRAGSLDGDKINAVIPTLDMPSMMSRIKFSEDHFSRVPLFYAQWFKVDTPGSMVVFSP